MFRSGTPASRSRNRLAVHRSNSQAPVPSGRRNGRGPNASRAASATSAPTWYRSGPIAGPMPARTSPGRAPRVSMAASAAPVTRATVPRHPAWTQASTRARGSYRTTGTQSATSTASTGPGSPVTRASASPTVSPGAAAPRPRSAPVTTRTAAPCTWVAKTRSPRPAPTAAAARRRFSTTWPGRSPTEKLRFSVAYTPAETPPSRVVTIASAPSPSRAGQASTGRPPRWRSA